MERHVRLALKFAVLVTKRRNLARKQRGFDRNWRA
jgi:hypothetical protein